MDALDLFEGLFSADTSADNYLSLVVSGNKVTASFLNGKKLIHAPRFFVKFEITQPGAFHGASLALRFDVEE